jgi:hypothetical protein
MVWAVLGSSMYAYCARDLQSLLQDIASKVQRTLDTEWYGFGIVGFITFAMRTAGIAA